MRKMKTLNYAAALRFKTPLRPIIRQDTRWGSTYAMVERYFRISEYLPVEDESCLVLKNSPSLDDQARCVTLPITLALRDW
ncbi:hypothetical protein F441_20663 [Phytophthora nicotianae CJ01A1]|uniref:Uncharacterized protein n=1 Tax=Phytophthora nicotianae CJ01A1 TaxID=1317063 RepID=W2VWZ0_PHYNI|nr:hypothetical protein F441_20663 [Phytophthora nicotianae CJ01A1]